MNSSHISRFMSSRPLRVASLLFLAALAPRLPGLDRFLTSDENTNIFFAGSDVIAAFLRGDFRDTYWHFYPGVTMSWLDALGMGGQYLLQWLSGAALPPFTEYIYGDILSLVVANRLPYAILTALAVPAIYLLARQLLPERVAGLGALFLAFDPFYLAHSRVAHGDAPLAVFMVLSTLTFLIYGTRVGGAMSQVQFSPSARFMILHPSSLYLAASAVFGGLAALTKAPGQVMPVVVLGLSALYAGLEMYQGSGERGAGSGSQDTLRLIIIKWLIVLAAWGVIFLAVFVLLWPVMWVDPIGAIQRMLAETSTKVDEGHLVYFFGQPTLDPGPWFYLYVIPFRMTPVVLIGVLLSLAVLPLRLPASPTPHPSRFTFHLSRFTPHFLWLFVFSLLLLGIFSSKKQDRYLLLLFPFLNLLAAVGWLAAFELLRYAMGRQFAPPLPLLPTFYSLLLFFHFIPVLTYYPYYLAYFNPLMGGPGRASLTTLMGWGEGMEQAAAYLNTKPNAERLYVASTPSQTLLPYFAGSGENFYTNDIAFRADYVVLYLAQMQRLAPSPEIIRYFEAQEPEKVVTIQGVTYAKIYRNHKLILTDIPGEAIPLNIGLDNTLRLAGYKIENRKPETQNQQLILYWHALAPLLTNYTISARARAADGQLLAQQDSWPVDGLLPTSQWRQGDYVADTHTLNIPEANRAPVDHFEVVVYNADTGETFGPPITLPLNNEQ